ncbi:MAG: ubiquinol oxidase subunit II [Gammaproteobacteria bacterium]|nr:ubiquinol oxidase subunit II [Gammaproteobacteria bacterium]
MKLRTFILICSTLLLSGCHFAILDPKGIIAASEKKLFVESILLMLIVVVPVIVMSIAIPWRYRASNTKAVYKPNWSHSFLMEAIWWTIPCVIIAILSVWTWIYTHKLDPYRPLAADKDTVMIEAIALDWKWLFIYPKQHMATVNFIEIPVNKPVRLFITSDAPMNSLEIPRLAGQIYAMTGMQTKLNIMATSTGTYSGLSTNFSGNGFSGMKFKVKVVQPTEYKTWLATAEKSPNHLDQAAYNELIKPSENNAVEYFSNVEPSLFSASIIKYMGPMPGMKLGYESTAQGASS